MNKLMCQQKKRMSHWKSRWNHY